MGLETPNKDSRGGRSRRQMLLGSLGLLAANLLCLPSPASAILLPIAPDKYYLPDGAGVAVISVDHFGVEGELNLAFNRGSLSKNMSWTLPIIVENKLRMGVGFNNIGSLATLALSIGPDLMFARRDTLNRTVDLGDIDDPHSISAHFNSFESGRWRFDRVRIGDLTFGL